VKIADIGQPLELLADGEVLRRAVPPWIGPPVAPGFVAVVVEWGTVVAVRGFVTVKYGVALLEPLALVVERCFVVVGRGVFLATERDVAVAGAAGAPCALDLVAADEVGAGSALALAATTSIIVTWRTTKSEREPTFGPRRRYTSNRGCPLEPTISYPFSLLCICFGPACHRLPAASLASADMFEVLVRASVRLSVARGQESV
jgi:hypothetical protein